MVRIKITIVLQIKVGLILRFYSTFNSIQIHKLITLIILIYISFGGLGLLAIYYAIITLANFPYIFIVTLRLATIKKQGKIN